MNKVNFDGRLVKDAEVRYMNSGDPILQFTVASDIGYGEKKTTNFFNCTIFGKRAGSLDPYLKKGLPVTVYGSLTLREFGEKRLSPDVRVDEITMHGDKKESYSPPAKKQPKLDDIDNDIPF